MRRVVGSSGLVRTAEKAFTRFGLCNVLHSVRVKPSQSQDQAGTSRATLERLEGDPHEDRYPSITLGADVYADIAELIGSDASPVGIDAKKTHIMILHKLIEIERRLGKLETQAAS